MEIEPASSSPPLHILLYSLREIVLDRRTRSFRFRLNRARNMVARERAQVTILLRCFSDLRNEPASSQSRITGKVYDDIYR